ncbi:MAG: ribosome small subunit-dependent GTPase A [Lachnospiraceae bacterium]|nr:ribosome small subunit-dependent GTPase A [Lachnospiraceae bacterium]
MQGKIIKGIAGFYYVDAEGKRYECKAKGIFRKDHRKPLVGDDVEMEILDEEKAIGNIRELLPRRSELIRPAVANVDQAMIIFAVTSPQPNFNLLDRFLIMMKQQDLPCLICFNKMDLDQENLMREYRSIYENSGYPVCMISVKQESGIEELRSWLKGKTTTVAGPSGVGKSSLINLLLGERMMETGALSEKIDRGKHTTRHSELLELGDHTYIFDTPGFSSLELFDIEKEELASFYKEFEPYEQNCRFGGCSHTAEPICGIKEAVKQKKISPVRYENYCLLYEELKLKKKY